MGGDQEMVTTDQQVLGRATVAQRWLARLGLVAAVAAVLVATVTWLGPETRAQRFIAAATVDTAQARYNKTRAAKLLGLTRAQLYSRIEKYGLAEIEA